ncbi:DUF6624 domain-containing protein [Hymenobacter cellulosilyticus]|uniref:DUF4919 domain-containing protein n=1 Tax=Hymenobacter cellulosilyticus TaxID=2932248 RepID=A0A8T9Q5B8_9BACT|nr:DUF6624 domain-containing protein [Hymenobacter cellulosilyticus]UOQ72866.1 hypothetical protein MUN79_02425 [Hymenobacter cellulosilyticus]
MKHILRVALLSGLALPAAAQAPKLNPQLKHELDSIYAVDQRYREMLFDPQQSRNPDSLAAVLGVPKAELNKTIMDRMVQTDKTNLARVQVLLKQYGYPGKTLVGTPTNEAVWHVIQHNPATIPQYLPLIKAAAEKGELPFSRYAMMLDRQLMTEGKEQLYGTQVTGYNGQPAFVWPIQNAAQVNQRRKQAGFTNTVEQNATRLGVTYKVLTLEDVAKMPKQ